MGSKLCRFVISWTLLIVAMVGANAQQCGSSITSCGCTIASAGVYTVDADLYSAQGLTSHGDCIDLAARNVSLLIANHAITGAGTGAGIHVLSSADHILIEGYSGSTFGTLSGWENGLESEASNVIADSMECYLNTTGILLQHKTTPSTAPMFLATPCTEFGSNLPPEIKLVAYMRQVTGWPASTSAALARGRLDKHVRKMRERAEQTPSTMAASSATKAMALRLRLEANRTP